MAKPRPTFRVLILNTPTLLGDLLTEAMMNHSDFTVIRERDLSRADDVTAPPDVVVVGRSVPDQEYAASILLARWPRSLVVGIADGRRGAIMYELEPTKVAVGDVSPRELVQAIRAMIRPDKRFRARRLLPVAPRRPR
jgi:hypothetical protein